MRWSKEDHQEPSLVRAGASRIVNTRGRKIKRLLCHDLFDSHDIFSPHHRLVLIGILLSHLYKMIVETRTHTKCSEWPRYLFAAWWSHWLDIDYNQKKGLGANGDSTSKFLLKSSATQNGECWVDLPPQILNMLWWLLCLELDPFIEMFVLNFGLDSLTCGSAQGHRCYLAYQ